MATVSRTNMLVVTAVVATAILGGAYVLGHTLGKPGGILGRDSQPRSDPGSTATPPTAATQPSASGPATPAPGTGELSPDPEHAPAPLPAERGGPFGARLTTGSRYVALTFDDGPDPRYTPQALAILRRYSVKATFCLVGTNVRAYPHLVRAIAADGHTLCNHSWVHDIGLGSRSRATILTDLARTNQAIRAAVPDARISYYRQPGGNWTPAVVTVARQLGMTSLHWTVDPRDWTRPGTGNIVASVTGDASPGAIVLLHDAGGNRQGTVNALYSIVGNLSRRFGLAALPSGAPPNSAPTGGPPATDGHPDAAPPAGVPADPPAPADPSALTPAPLRHPARF